MITIKLEQEELIPNRYYSGTLNFNQGSLTKICGDNGVGKSTFFNFCQTNQELLFKSPVCFLEQKALHALHDYSLEEVENLLARFWSPFFIKNWLRPWKQMMHDFHLKPTYKIHQLSGGQNQLLKLMLSSLLDREIYFWDEPFTSLDPQMVEWWSNWIKLQIDNNKTLVVIDHSKRLDKIIHQQYILAFKKFDLVEFTLESI